MKRLLGFMFILSAASLVGCAAHNGPMEKAGRSVDKAASKTVEAVGKAVEKTGEALERGGESIQSKVKSQAPASRPEP
jgi:predicted small secreted protein